RTQVLQAGLDRLEPRPVGRPPRPAGDDHVRALEARVAEVEIELRAARGREEIALALPQVPVAPAAPGKKTPPRRSPTPPRPPPDEGPRVAVEAATRAVLEAAAVAAPGVGGPSGAPADAAAAGWSEGIHVQRLQQLLAVQAAAADPPRRRGSIWQQPRRQLEA